MAKAKKSLNVKPFHLATIVFIVLFVAFAGYYFGFDTGFEKATKNSNSNSAQAPAYPDSLEFDNPDGSKKIEIEAYGMSFLLPKDWKYDKSEIQATYDDYNVGIVTLKDPTGNSKIDLMPNVTTGWCEGVKECIKSEFNTEMGLMGTRFDGAGSELVYLFPEDQSSSKFPWLVIRASGDREVIENIINLVGFPALQK